MNLEKLLPYLPSITTLIATTYAIYALNFELNKKNEPNKNSNSNLNEDKNSEEQNTSNKEKKKEEHGKIAPIFKNDSRKYLTNKGVLAVLLLLLSCAISLLTNYASEQKKIKDKEFAEHVRDSTMKAELRIRDTTRRAEQKIINDLKKSLDTTMKMASKVSEQVLKSDSISRTTILIASRLSKAVEKVEKNTALTQSVLSESIDRLGVLNVRISLMVKSSLLDSLDKLNRLTKENLEEILLGFWRYNFTFAKACDEVLKENRFQSGTFWFEGDRRKNISKFDATTILDEKGGTEDQDIECIIEYSIPINSTTGITKYSDLNGLCWCSKIYHSEFVDVYYIRLDFGQVHEEEKSLELINNNQPNGIHEDYILRFENNGDLVKKNSFTYVGCYSIPRDFIKKAKH